MMISTMRNNRLVRNTIAILFWMAVWQLCAMLAGSQLILPGPLTVFERLLSLIVTAEFWQNTGITILRIIGGYLAGLVIGTLLAIISCVSPLFDALFSPAVKTIRATPVASFIILALLWMGKNIIPSLMAALMVIPVVWGNIVEQYKAVDVKLIEMARAYRFTKMKKFRYIYVPSILPAFKAACLTSMGLSWKSGIAAEVLTQPSLAIGSNLYYSKVYLETPELFAWTIVVVILSFLIEKVIRKVINGFLGGYSYESK